MEKKIALIRLKMIIVISLILTLGGWQHAFIMQGIAAHMEMTLTILATFAFAIVLSFIFVSKLKNEVVAFQALREMWDDIRAEHTDAAMDPLWKHARCTKPAKVFHRPRLLGHAYELVTDEVARTKKIRVSVETMNTLVHTIEQSIHDEKSMIVYMSGLLVFMGLIGTFIGLLQMVSAIGGIIGSLAQSAGGAGATGAFQELLAALQEPLKGMASGFASSLFGLFSSLVVGLLGRFAGQAANVLKQEFEAWLAGLVKFGDDETVDAQGLVLASGGSMNDPALVRMVGGILTDYGRLAGSFERVAHSLEDIRAKQAAQAHAHETMAAEVAAFCRGQGAFIQELSAARIGPTLRDMTDRLCGLGANMGRQFETDMKALRDVVEDSARGQSAGLRTLAAQQATTAGQLVGAIEQLAFDIDRRAAQTSSTDVAGAVERRLSTVGAEIGRALSIHSEQQAMRLGALEQAQSRMLDVVQHGGLGHAAQSDAALEQALDRLNDTVTTAFSAYSSILQVSLTALERSAERHASSASAQGHGPMHGAA